MTAALRVLHIASGLGLGGAETMLHRLMGALHGRDGQSHSVVSLTDNNAFDFASLGVPVDIIDIRRGPAALLSLRALLRRQAPDVIQGWMYHGNLLASFVAPAGVPVSWSVHHSLHDLRHEPASLRALVRAGRWFSGGSTTRSIVYCSHTSRMQHEAAGYPPSKGVVIANGFDTERFRIDPDLRRHARKQLGVGDDAIVLGSFGRWHPIKDHALLVGAFARVSRERPHALLVLAGTGIDESNRVLISQLETAGVAARVRLLGQRSDMPALYNALDGYVLSSRSEAFPNVLGEAAACGVPALTTDVGDAARIVQHSGLLVSPGDLAAMAAGMVTLLDWSAEYRRQRGALARAHLEAHYALPNIARQYRDLFGRLASLESLQGGTRA